MKKVILFLTLVGASVLVANSEEPKDLVVSFDTVSIDSQRVDFAHDWKELRPDLSEFKIDYRRFLSNQVGERYALVTLVKEKGALRILDTRDVVGILANGQRLYPLKIEGEAQIGPRGSVLLHFGTHKFPLVGLETRNN